MRHLVYWTCMTLLLGGMGCGSQSEADLLQRNTHEIINGVDFDGLPAIGALTIRGQTYCTGTLIDSRTVLTAGHCTFGSLVDKFSIPDFRFNIGPDAKNSQYSLKVAELKPHPQYQPSEYTGAVANDIGLVYLAEDAPVEPLALETYIDNSWVGTSLLFVGYGVDNAQQKSGVGHKRAAQMQVVGLAEQLIFHADASSNVCLGDSGGPGMYQDENGDYVVVGVTSWVGNDSCAGPWGGGQMRVDMFLDFIGAQPCGNETAQGRCEGNTVVHCVGGYLSQEDCALKGATCALDGASVASCMK